MQKFENILLSAKTIAVVGLSKDESKDSHSVAKYLQSKGYKIIPINPTTSEILGETVYSSLSQVKEKVDIVDIFRPSEECETITLEALTLKPKMVWLQLGIKNDQAKSLCEKNNVVFVQDKCIRTEHKLLTGFK